MAIPDEVLELKNVSKIYGSGETAVTAVDRAELAVGPGEIVLIMGPSGSGKTTLLSLAGCLLSPTQGEVDIAGQNVTLLNERSLPQVRLSKIGFIFQSFNLLAALTALENVVVVLRFSGRPRREARAKATELLTDLGLGERLDHLPGQLSGGEKQRVAIARALANDPELILADEPTANLDSKTGHTVVELLHEIASERQKSIVIVSHDMRIMDIADRVLQIEDGRLSEGPMVTAKDPVCGMILPKAKAAATVTRENETHYFCSLVCRNEFLGEPGRFLDE